ncbi:hypothetical protein [Dysgonomonas capnocytophagoides]|uniref:hypothetical protein n=2 Tax=Dysgonomonadaceae TaxID=2005520 RepID=UPI00041AA109|nr:hypothetical protein [Dysgonomonas capnocytophagoides]MBS7122389.1 hypothetical protein [Dysgonomonas sp.]
MEPEYEFTNFISYSLKTIEKTKKGKTADWYQLSIDNLCWFYGRKKIDIRDITVIGLMNIWKSSPKIVPYYIMVESSSYYNKLII